MNCPSKTDPEIPDDWNQSPDALSADSTTRSDLDRIANARRQRDHRARKDDSCVALAALQESTDSEDGKCRVVRGRDVNGDGRGYGEEMLEETLGAQPAGRADGSDSNLPLWRRGLRRVGRVLKKYSKFIGPGFMVSVAYIDPGNYSTDVAAGATYRFKLLFMVLVSNIFAIFLQSLCIRLGSVTGLNLAEMCKAHCPPWLNYFLYAMAEAAIIATDIAEVIGTAIALNLLSGGKIPLVAGCAISIVDVLFILLFYRPKAGSMKALRVFEIFVACLVVGVVICFCFELSRIDNINVREVFRGYAPSSAIIQGQGLYQACGILGATVMPHSLYLGSGIIQARLKDFDEHHSPSSNDGRLTNVASTLSADAGRTGTSAEDDSDRDSVSEKQYRPSLSAIKSCMSYSIAELAISLFTFALFVNSAILIVAGASLSNVSGASDATLFGIYHLLSHALAPAAGTIFALALLLSGISAGIVCTIAGQMVSEGQLSLRVRPWVRRLMTRSISITPSIIVAGAMGAEGVSKALNGSQFALSVILPFVSAPLIYFTCRNKYMTVRDDTSQNNKSGRSGTSASSGMQTFGIQRGVGGINSSDSSASGTEVEDGNGQPTAGMEGGVTVMSNGWITIVCAVVIWLIIVVMNVASLVLVGLGKN